MVALQGLKVIEVGNILAGPFCGTMLADFGAEVIKVEPPGIGDLCRNMGKVKDLWFQVEGRNKKTVSLNLKTAKGKQLLWDLLKDADVLVENFRPGVFAKLGFTWEKIHEYNPRLVFMSSSGYGQTGPYSHKPGFDRIGLGMGGILHVTGLPDGPPMKPGLSLIDCMTAMFGVMGVMFAIYNRDIVGSGLGQRVDCCLTDSSIRVLESIIPEYFYDGSIRNRMGNSILIAIPSGHFLTKDGQYFVMTVGGDALFANFAKAIGRADLLESDKYSKALGRIQNREEINKIAEDWVREHTISECLAAFGDDVPCCKVYTVKDIAEDAHFAEREMIVEMPSKKFGSVKMQGIVPKLSGTPGKVAWAGPEIGEYNEEVYCGRLGRSKEELASLIAEGVI